MQVKSPLASHVAGETNLEWRSGGFVSGLDLLLAWAVELGRLDSSSCHEVPLLLELLELSVVPNEYYDELSLPDLSFLVLLEEKTLNLRGESVPLGSGLDDGLRI